MRRRSSLSGALAILLVWIADVRLHACPICFRVDDESAVSGIYAAVFVLIGVTTVVLSGFATFIVRFVRRARLSADERVDSGR
jgi:uncharacterized membrane protein